MTSPSRAQQAGLVRHLTGSAAGYSLSRFVGFASLIVVLPLVADTYGLAGMGIYAALTSLTAFLSALDSGVGGSVRTSVVEAVGGSGPPTRGLVRALRRDAFRWTVGAVLMSTVLALAIPWGRLLLERDSQTPTVSFSVVVAAFAAIYLAGVLQQVNTRVLEGLGRTGLAAALSVVGPIFTVVSTVVACTMQAPLMVTVILPAFAPLLTGMAGRVALHRLVRETMSDSAADTGGVEAAVALPMIAISLTYAVSYSMDYWLVSALLGVERTGEYAAAARPAQIFLVLASASAPVLWTHFVRARVGGESAVLSARAVTRMCVGFLAVGLPAGAAYAGAVGVLGSHLTAGLATPGAPLILAFAVWGVALVSHQPFAMVLNTASGLRFQLLSMGAAAIVNVSLKLVMTPAFGPAGAVWASCFSLIGIHIPLLAWWVWRSSRPVTRSRRLARLAGDPPAFPQDDEVP